MKILDDKNVIKALEQRTLAMLDGFYANDTSPENGEYDVVLNDCESHNDSRIKEPIPHAMKENSLIHRLHFPSESVFGVYGFILAKNCVKNSKERDP